MKYTFLSTWFHERPFHKRQHDVNTVLTKYPAKIPIVVGPASESTPNINANKFIVPGDLSVTEFMQAIRLRIPITPQTALFLYLVQIDGKTSEEKVTLLTGSQVLSQVYKHYISYDGFLYILYDLENTFG